MSTITTGDDAEIYRSERDTERPQVLKSRLHKFTEEESRMQPIAAGRGCRWAGLRGRRDTGEPHHGIG